MISRYKIEDDRPSPSSTETNLDFMEAAWLGFVEWAIGAPDVIAQWEKETGRKMAGPPRTGLDAAIDKATGYDYTEQRAKDLEDFVIWATINLWGEDEAPAKMRAKIKEQRKCAGG